MAPISRYAVLCGSMKTGTSALFHWLSRHPQIAACREKEPGYWNDPRQLGQGMQGYEALWDFDPGVHRWALEASTHYTKLPLRTTPAGWFARLPAEFRVIFVCRHPVERLRSQYLHSLAKGWLTEPITKGIDPRPLFFSSYGMQMEPFARFLDRRRILVVQHEEFTRDPRAVVDRIVRFLDLEPAPLEDPGRRNDSSRWRATLLARQFAATGELDVRSNWARLERLLSRGQRFEEFAQDCRELLGARRVDAALRAIEVASTPTEDQALEIARDLDGDLKRFADTWGVDPWAGRHPAETHPLEASGGILRPREPRGVAARP